ncbi:MAG: FecR family protein, partial [Pirellulales bacterium]|nr:FecR family protein [Pirellulales bacterium]
MSELPPDDALSKEDAARLDELICALDLDTITPAEGEELTALLKASSAARLYYMQAVEMSGLLRQKSDAEPIASSATTDESPTQDEPNETLVTPRPRPWFSRNTFHTGVVVAAVIFTVALMLLDIIPAPRFIAGDDDDHMDSVAEPKEIATLTNWHRPKWVKEHAITPGDHRIEVGQRIAFTSGLVEITYDTGAKVVIEGPAEFVAGAKEKGERRKDKEENIPPSSFILHPSNSGYLAFGRLAARCETRASKGFTIATPVGAIEDLGTEFGVSVDSERRVVSEVFSGSVEVSIPQVRGDVLRRRLAKGARLEWPADIRHPS